MEKRESQLQALINVLTANSKLHICVYDMSNILNNDIMSLKRQNTMHLSEICSLMKRTKKGLARCMRCRSYVNHKVYSRKKTLVGQCLNGLTEIVQPVIYNGRVMCVIYIGNFYTDKAQTARKLMQSAKKCGCPEQEAVYALSGLQPCTDLELYIQMAAIIKEYIIMLFEKYHVSLTVDSHWIVEDLKNHIASYYSHSLILSDLTSAYRFNDKYIGRIFKKHTGFSFAEYLNRVRIQKACILLKTTDKKMIEIALSVGYENISYFNRTFKKVTGLTPLEYRNEPDAQIPGKLF